MNNSTNIDKNVNPSANAHANGGTTLAPVKSTTNLLDTAAANGTFNTFGKAVGQAGLEETLRGPGPFTIFAPTDAAFEKLPADRLEALFKPENQAELAAILNYHIVKGRRTEADVRKWDSARTVNGQPAPITLEGGELRIDDARVTSCDIDSSNGLIHAIDKVNMPTVTRQ